MKAFNGDASTKAALMRRLTAHAGAGEVVAGGERWDGRKGAVSGCLLHDADVTGWEAHTGLPAALAHIVDFVAGVIVPAESGAAFALYWLSIVPVGADLTRTPAALVAHLLGDPDDGVIRHASGAALHDAGRSMARLHERAARAEGPTADEWREARTLAMGVTDGCEGLAKLVGECVEASGWDFATAPAAVGDVLAIWSRVQEAASGKAFLDDPIRASVKAKMDEIYPELLELNKANPEVRLDIFEFLKQRAPDYYAIVRHTPHIGVIRDALIGLTLST